jgi:Tfp pilus assembly protein PilX
MNNFLRDQSGTALYLALMILTGALIVSLGAASLVMSGLKLNKTQFDSTKAIFAAEAGAERILWETRKNSADLSSCNADDYVNFDLSPADCDSNTHVYSLVNGASYYVLFESGGAATTTVSVGGYQDVKRSVEISY